ncbi:MAG: hypothetical protein QNJ11_10155 [Woeseiaceae bacterium]|nr:hypothetical protein [Woeseiaceae bacterium]
MDVKRTTWGIVAMLLVVAVIAFTVLSWPHQAPRSSEPYAANTDQSQPGPRVEVEPRGFADPDVDDYQTGSSEAGEPQSESRADLVWLREETGNDVIVTYAQLFRHLGLTETEERYLTDFLVEVWMSKTIMRNYRPEPIAEEDRRAGIAAIIGDIKLEKLLTMELNKAEYEEAGLVSKYLRSNGVPLTDRQQDQLLDILIHVQGREQAVANPNALPGTVEEVGSRIDMMDEYERLVLELAPSVLSSRQMELFFDRYQALSYRRAEMLELQKKTRANEDEDDDFPLGYPARN